MSGADERLRSRRGRAMTAFMLRGALARCATRRVGRAALAGVGACVAGLVWRHHRLGGLELLDARGGYTPDVLENLTVAALALGHAGPPSPVAWLAAGFTLVKTVLIVATLAATGAGAVRRLWVRMRH